VTKQFLDGANVIIGWQNCVTQDAPVVGCTLPVATAVGMGGPIGSFKTADASFAVLGMSGAMLAGGSWLAGDVTERWFFEFSRVVGDGAGGNQKLF